MLAPLKGLTGCMNRIAVLLRPDPDTAERLTKAQAQVREFIIHMRRNDRMHGTGDQPVRLHLPHRLGQHFLAHTANAVAKLSKAQSAMFRQRFQHKHRPLVRNAAK